jgi:cobyrinic acid a,c-diamide synthase
MKKTSSLKNKSHAICIAGTQSGCGKTTVSLGIMAALTRRGHAVQPFKVGPDFIDPGHHTRVTGRDSHNLDGWMMTQAYNREIFSRYSRDADVAVIEGVMGLFDGFSGKEESGSTAQMAKWLKIPLFLVIDARSMARSAAAIALGFSLFDPDISISGIIFNRIGSEGHKEIIQDAMDTLSKVPVIGYLPREEGLEIPSRHLGLVTDEDYRIDQGRVESLAQWIESNLDLDRLLTTTQDGVLDPTQDSPTRKGEIKIGLAKDEAFSFYYPENLRLLREAGAELIPFSPIHEKKLPEGITGLILGGGYPELHCKPLAENRSLLKEIKDFGLNGGPIYAECGGFMFLMNQIRDQNGKNYPMVGLFPMEAVMEHRLKSLGYREIVTKEPSLLGPSGTRIRGHEFHYSSVNNKGSVTAPIYKMTDRKASSKGEEGFLRNNVLGSYVHLHWGSNPDVAGHFVDFCRNWQR